MPDNVQQNALHDEAQLDHLQKQAFLYFLEQGNDLGLVADTSRSWSPCSIAVVGFALSSYPVGVSRGWMTRQDAIDRTLLTLRFFANSAQGPEEVTTGYKGFYYHFLDMKTGLRTWNCELSLIDTALLLAGILTAAVFFDGENASEAEIRKLADFLYARMDWEWARGGMPTISQGWLPGSGFLHYSWEGYSEAIILYALALGAPTMPLGKEIYKNWRDTYQWENIYGMDYLYAGPLFIHLFSHAWIDFRGIRDSFFDQKNSDYFQNTQAAIAVQREYARRNPKGFKGYACDLWGFTACDGPDGPPVRVERREQYFFGYAARGVPYGPDDGTIAPWASLASLPFSPEAAMSCLNQTLATYPNLVKNGRFPSAYNPTRGGSGPEGWVADYHSGLDQGLIVLMIENFRTGMIWDLIKKSAPLRAGLKNGGFGKGWLA